MPTTCMDFLTKKKDRGEPPPVLVVFGDEEFLRQRAKLTVRHWVVGPEADDFTLAFHDGEKAELASVLDDLWTPPFLGVRRLVVVEEAETFVTRNRAALEKYVAKPSTSGVLLLETKTWTATTKLAKAVEATGLAIDAKAPKDWHVAAWCVAWCKNQHGKTLAKLSAEWLVELAGTSLGVLDQELAKLTTYVGQRSEITAADIQRVVAGARADNAFQLLEAALEGNGAKAIAQLDRQLVAGDSPIMIAAMLTAQLRKLTRAARAAVAGAPLDEALRAAGVPPFALEKNRAHLRRLGRERMAEMYRRLLALDLDLKGGTALGERVVLERFLLEAASGPIASQGAIPSPDR